MAGQVRSRAEILLQAVNSLPPLPAVAMRVMQVSQDPRASASDLALVVSADPGLSATILRVANSAAYARAKQVTSVQEALVVLGFVQARNIAVSGAITSRYAPDALNALFRIDAFWRHSIAVGFRASELAGKSRRLDVPSAFTAGILHNMGRLAMFYADPAGLDQVVAEMLRSGRPLEDVEREMLGYDHAEVGGALARRWRLPADIADAVSKHHAAADLPEITLASVVAQANEFCMEHGIYPGYVVPGAEDVKSTPELARLMKRVDQLMTLITGPAEPVRVVA